MIYEKVIKRPLDIVGGLIGLPFFALSFVIVAPMIHMEDKGPVFYKAVRRGKYGKPFEMLKYRSMIVDAPDLRNEDNSTYNSTDDFRVTRIGKLLRKTSIDELPQIINVLKGEMSFVGPRPITVNRPLEEYDEKRRIRLRVKPGITGFTQAYYRNSIGQEEKLEYDAEYAQNVTFKGDVKILLKTIQTVLKRKNIYLKEENISNVHIVDGEKEVCKK